MATTPPFQPTSCLRCGIPIHATFAGSLQCPRCASEHLLAMTLARPSVSAPPFNASGPIRIGPYEILSEIGRGGMGTVYLAQHAQLGSIVALKALPSTGSASSSLEIRFLREARTVAQLRHPHIVTVHDAGRTDTYAYFAMDYVEDGDVAQRLRRERQFDPKFAAQLLMAVASAIAYSHREGVLHRDLKPSNILLDGDHPRVADFGLAAQLDSGGDLTATHCQIGTPHYLAPEVLSATGEQGVAADIYALGVILYEMVTGRTPFAGATPAALASLVATVDPPELRLLAPHAPRDLETICRHCLEIDPTRRYPTADAVAEDLRRFLAGKSILAQPVSVPTQLWRWAHRRPQLAALWVVSFALALGSSLAAIGLNRARLETTRQIKRTEQALASARTAETLARERLRDAKLAEARARLRSPESGRSTAVLTALAEASAIRPGADLQAEGIEALMLPEFQIAERWPLAPTIPIAVTVDPTGRIAVVEELSLQAAPRGTVSLRRWGEPLSFAILSTPGTTLAGTIRFNSDGTRLMTRYQDESLRVWDTIDGALKLELPHLPLSNRGSENQLRNDDFDFTANGRSICVGADNGGVVWFNTADGIETARSPGPVRFTTLRCSPQSDRVAACSIALQPTGRHDLFIYETPGGPPTHRFPLASVPLSIAWSPDGRLLVLTQIDHTVTTFDVPNRRVLYAFSSPVLDPRMITVLAGGRHAVVSGIGSTTRVLNLATGLDECELSDAGPAPITRDATGNTFYIGSAVGDLVRWHWRESIGSRRLSLPDHAGYEYSGDAGGLDVSLDAKWAASAHGRYAAVRDLTSGAMIGEIDGGESSTHPFSSVMFDPAGSSLLHCTTTTGLLRYPYHQNPDGRLTFESTEILDDEPGFLLTAHSGDRRRLVLINRVSGDVKIVDLAVSGAPILVSRWQTPGVNHGSLNPDASLVLLNCNGVGPTAATMRLSVHRTTDGTIVAEPDAPVSCDTAWSHDGLTALTSNGQSTSVVWNPSDWSQRTQLQGTFGGNTTTFALAPDGTYAVICHDTTVNVVSTSDGSVRQTFHVPQAPGFASIVQFLPNHEEFAVLWPDGALDIFAPAALSAALAANQIH